MESESGGRIVALCGVQRCCPTAEFTGDSVILHDDLQCEVILTRDEWVGFLAKAKAGELD